MKQQAQSLGSLASMVKKALQYLVFLCLFASSYTLVLQGLNNVRKATKALKQLLLPQQEQLPQGVPRSLEEVLQVPHTAVVSVRDSKSQCPETTT